MRIGGNEPRNKVYNEDEDEWFDEIQQAIVEAEDGNTLRVYPGIYEEWVSIDKPLTLLGPNAGIPGNPGDRGEEALIVPPADAPLVDPYALFPDVIWVTAEDVVIDGFKLKPLNPNPEPAVGSLNILESEDKRDKSISQITIELEPEFEVQSNGNNNDYQATNGIFGDEDGLEIRNNIIKGFPNTGVWVYRSSGDVDTFGPITGIVVADNYIKESYDGNGFGFYIQGVIGHILNNTVEEIFGNQIQPYGAVADPGEGLVSGNTISAYGISFWHNVDNEGGEWTYSENTLTADPNASWWNGIRITTVYNDPTLIFTDNTIDGMGVMGDDVIGLRFTGDVSKATCDNLDFSDNTIKGLDICVKDESTGKHVDLTAIEGANVFPDGDTEIVDHKIKYVE